jgi:endonuclease I
MFYMAVRYEGEVLALDCAGSIVHEPDLTLVNDLSLVRTRNDAWEAGSAAFMGLLDVLLQWHAEDPPDDFERRRNTVVYLFQRNRNPFIDHPEWVEAIFGTPSA